MTSQADRFARAMRADARVIRAAHPFVASMLEAVRRPVMRLPRIGLLVQQTDLVREVMSDTDRFTKNGPGASSDLWTPVLGDRVLVNMHGPDHHAMRRTLQPIFAPGFVNELVREMVEPRWKQAAASFAAGDRVDIAKVTREGASDAIAVLVGLDRGAVDDAMFESVTQITGMVKLTRPRLTDQQAQRARDLLAQLTEHAHAAYAGDESTVPGRMRALGLSEREALGAVGAFILTGTETLAGAIPRITAMLADADWFSQLTDDAAADRAIAESLRWTTPSLATLRSALVDTEIGGAKVQKGDRIVLATYKANRQRGPWDPTSDRVAGLRQLWFGAGEHFCIGAPLAMAQIRTAITALRSVEGRLQATDRTPLRNTVIPSYRSLVMEARR